MIEDALQMNRTLIVLDDVLECSQLVALLGTGKINARSKIIITTREDTDNWFEPSCWRCQKYEMRLLDDDESLELLSRHAFGSKIPNEGYMWHLQEATRLCEGNPLALEVLGSSLLTNDTTYWESLLSLFGKDIDSRIDGVLIRSYMSLPCNTVKDLFLHIACFFIGIDMDYVVKILEPDYSATSGIKILIKRCLLSVSPNKKLMMHRLLQEMGKNIVHQESTKLPARRSRVWRNIDSYKILSKGKGSETIEGLALDMKMLQTEHFAFTVRGWRKTGRPKQVNPSFIELKTIRCIIHGPQLEDMYNIAEMSKSSIGAKNSAFTISLLEGGMESNTRSDETMEKQKESVGMSKAFGSDEIKESDSPPHGKRLKSVAKPSGGQELKDSSSLIPAIGPDNSIICLLKCSRSDFGSIASLNRQFRDLIRSGALYKLRRQYGIIEHWVYFSCHLVQWEAFDPFKQRWMSLPPMSLDTGFQFSDRESLAVGTELLVLGKEVLDLAIYKYSLLTNSWSSGQLMKMPRCLFGSASLGEIAIVAGGYGPNGNILSSAELYNSESGAWETLPNMHTPRAMCSGVFMDNKFYVIGGISETYMEPLTSVEEYDLGIHKWRKISNMSPVRAGGAANATSATEAATTKARPLVAVVDNELYAADCADMEVRKYVKERNKWETIGRLPEQANSMNGWSIAFRGCGDRLIVIGGPKTSGAGFIEVNSWVPRDGPLQWTMLGLGDTIDYTEVRIWRKTGRLKQVNPSFTELKTIRCIIHGPQLEDIYTTVEMSTSSVGDKSVALSSSLEVYDKQQIKSGLETVGDFISTFDEITIGESDPY
ncbi:hypothetical protein M8C21_023191, partial [Ambrosia artemisiifolia]